MGEADVDMFLPAVDRTLVQSDRRGDEFSIRGGSLR